MVRLDALWNDGWSVEGSFNQLNPTSVWRNLHRCAERAEKELKDQKTPSDFFPKPAAIVTANEPLAIGIDGGYVHACDQPSRREGWFEVIVGKSIGEGRPTRCFGYVQCYDEKPKCRIDELLKSQGLERGHPVIFLSDGGETVRNLPLELYPDGEHILLVSHYHATHRDGPNGQRAGQKPESGSDFTNRKGF